MTGLTLENHLKRDTRLNNWSVYGLGGQSHPIEEWVKCILDVTLQVDLPPYLQEMFDRAQASMVYGCYHYPLFTLGIEELFRFGESAFLEAIKEAAPNKSFKKKNYAALQKWALDDGLINDATAKRWDASRHLRNSGSHKRNTMLLGPNDAINNLFVTKELTEALFASCRSRAKSVGQP